MPALSVLPVETHPWSALLTRPDVTLDRGILHLRHDSVTAAQAETDDLLLVASALEQRRHRHDAHPPRRTATPAIVVDVAERDAAFDALRALGRHEPLYLKPRRGTAILAAEVAEAPDEPSSWRVFRPRVTRRGGLRYGASVGARLEFWRFGETHRGPARERAPADRRPTRTTCATRRSRSTAATWRTIDGMFDPQPDEFTEPVDIVFSWVDGSSSEFQRQRAAQMAGYVVGEGDDGPARYRQVDELRYALRSVHMHAPWVRRIFIATDSPAPAWLLEHPKVTIVRSEEFFADTSALPIHNSHAVEAQLHRIEGLAEHFLYSNDDMFFARRVEPELFFTSAGVTKFVECEIRIGAGAPVSRAQRPRQRPAGQPRPPAGALRPHDRPRPRALRDAAAPQRHGRDGAVVRRRLRTHGLVALPLGDRHLGDELPVPLLRAHDRAGPSSRVDPACGTCRRRWPVRCVAWRRSPTGATSTCSASTTAGSPRSPRTCG